MTRARMGLLIPSLLATLWMGTTPVGADDILEVRDWTLAEPVNALGPIEPNGTWKVNRSETIATGTAAPWTIQTAGDPNWTDYKLGVKVTIRKAAPKADYRITSSEFDRYLPREGFPPGNHTGQVRYRFFAGEFDWGSDAAVFVRYRDRENCYRVQLSTEYQEMILWHGTGGYLQIVDCPLQPGKTYRLDVVARGRNVQVFLDGKKMIDYWHRTLPTRTGGIGLGAYRSTVAFGDLTVTRLPAPTAGMPRHEPRFRMRKWRTLDWIFDGAEPICMFDKFDKTPGNKASEWLNYRQVKLVPGYRPYYGGIVGVFVQPRRVLTTPVGDVDEFKITGQDSPRLVMAFDSVHPEGLVRMHSTDTITFDAIRGTYRHDIRHDLEFLKKVRTNTIEFNDPLTYNNKFPGRGVKHRWLPAGHRWSIFPGEDGKVYRHPISQSTNLPGQVLWQTARTRSFRILYPDRAACPVNEHEVPGVPMQYGLCHWGFDFHERAVFGWRDFAPGEKLTLKLGLTAYPPHEAERWFRLSQVHPKHNRLVRANRKGVPYKNNVPNPFAYPVCDPAGNDFTRLHSIREPYVGWQWRGDYVVDTAVGHNDNYSLRITGKPRPARRRQPAEVVQANGMFYHHMIDVADRYLCTVWLKTRATQGEGPTFTLKYTYRDAPSDRIVTYLAGDNDWTKLSFVTSVPGTGRAHYDSSSAVLELTGEGTVWMDDFSIRPLGADESVTEQLPERARVVRATCRFVNPTK